MAIPSIQRDQAVATMLFTDIEGSTALLREHGETYDLWLAEHFAVLSEAVASSGGVEIVREGDALMAVFDDAASAIDASVKAQTAFASEPWISRGFRVRMGVHTGPARLTAAGWVGLGLHQAARIVSCAHGAQTICSDVTAEIINGSDKQRLPREAVLLPLGRWRVRDFDDPERLWQLAAPGLRREFPHPRTAPAAAHNLPPIRTTFVGRAHELNQIVERLDSARLTTLTGPGGVGKTRLSFEVVRQVAQEYADGAVVAALAAVTTGDAAIREIATALGVREEPHVDLSDTMLAFLQGKHMLLMLDNCEHVAEAAADLIDRILDEAPDVTLLTSSRRALGVYGEQVFAVETMAVPTADVPLELLASTEALSLFVDRAAAARNGFALNNENATACVAICAAVDGLPLAIELAAARLSGMDLPTLHQRLDDTLSTLVSTRARGGQRQSTIVELVTWSYELLSAEAQKLFRALSVFRGGFTTADVEAVASTVVGFVPALLDELADNSLISESDGRYVMLVVVRDVAASLLERAGETELVHGNHLAHFTDVAVRAGQLLDGPDYASKLARLDAEAENLDAALEFGLGDAAAVSAAHAGRLATALAAWSIHRGRAGAALAQIKRAMPRAADADRAGLLAACANLDRSQADAGLSLEHANAALDLMEADDSLAVDATLSVGLAQQRLGQLNLAEASARRALALAERLDDIGGRVRAMGLIGDIAASRGQFEIADEIFAKAFELADSNGYKPLLINVLLSRSACAKSAGQVDEGTRWTEEAVAIAEACADASALPRAMLMQANFSMMASRPDEASGHVARALEVAIKTGDRPSVARAKKLSGWFALMLGDRSAALADSQESLDLGLAVGDRLIEAGALNNLGVIAMIEGDLDRALQFLNRTLELHEAASPLEAMATLNNLAAVRMEMNDWTEATRLLTRTFLSAREVGFKATELMALCNLGYMAMCEGELETAETWLNECLASCAAAGGSDADEGRSLGRLAMIHAWRGDYELAKESLEAAVIKDPSQLTHTVESPGLRVFLAVKSGKPLDLDAVRQIIGTLNDAPSSPVLGGLAIVAAALPAGAAARMAAAIIRQAEVSGSRLPVKSAELLDQLRGAQPAASIRLPSQLGGPAPVFADVLRDIVDSVAVDEFELAEASVTLEAPKSPNNASNVTRARTAIGSTGK